MSPRGGARARVSAAIGLLCLLAVLSTESAAQQGKPKVPPQLPPQASEQAQQQVSQHTAPEVSLTAPAADTLYTAPATVLLEANASASSSGRSITRVEFFAGTTLIGTTTAAPYAFAWAPVAPGTYSLTAKATDDLGVASTSALVAIIVNAPPSVSLTSPAGNATFTAPATISLSAQALDTDGTIARVEFYNGTNLIGALTEPPFSTNWLLVPAGSYSLTTRVTDNLGATAVSEAVSVTVNQALAQIYYIHTDHLNTPRAIYNQQQQLVWRWDNTDPFGGNAPDENPSGLSTFTCNLRLPGQYFDRETNLYYNDFRDYDPAIGRYIQSDLIGLLGGLNTYAYARGDPLYFVDPSGLDVKICHFPGGPTHTSFGVGDLNTSIQTHGFYPSKHRRPYSPGIVSPDDLKEKGTQCQVIVTTSKQDECMKRCQKRWTDDPGTYDWYRRNCSTYVHTCLSECSLPAGTDSFWPKTLYESLPGTPIPAVGIPNFYP